MRKSCFIVALAAVFAAIGVAACGTKGGDGPAADAGSSPAAVGSGIPVTEPTRPVDPGIASRGKELFQRRGCAGCHTIGKGRLTGPDLAGVTERRSFEWLYRMVTVPDSMTRSDPEARRLMEEYMTPMPDLNVRPAEAKALYEYLRSTAG